MKKLVHSLLCSSLIALPLASCSSSEPKPILQVFDLKAFIDSIADNKVAYDYLKLAATLQGLVNRDKPQLYFLYESNYIAQENDMDSDQFWLTYLTKKGNHLSGYRLNRGNDFFKLLEQYHDQIDGLVLWDQEVPATSNVASTVSGVENLLPVRYDPHSGSVYDELVQKRNLLPVKKTLVDKFTGQGTIVDTDIPSTGSAKNDAYLWAKANYLDTNLTNPVLMEYALDAYTWKKNNNTTLANNDPEFALEYPDNLFNTFLPNADYYIANKAFFFDLSPDFAPPVDDREQEPGTDLNTLESLLKSQRQLAGNHLITIGGFVPWFAKYTKFADPEANLEPTQAEFKFLDLASSYNAQKDADAYALTGLSNASVFQHIPLNTLKQNNDKGANNKLVYEQGTKYIAFYMGDYDAGAWTSSALPALWNDPKRGELPLAWSVVPGLSVRVPHAYNYVYSTMTDNDYFVAGDNGAGYLNPIMLKEQNRPEGVPPSMNEWQQYNSEYYSKFDLDISGFIISGNAKLFDSEIQEMYSRISPIGVGVNTSFQSVIVNDTPFIQVEDAGHEEKDAEAYARMLYDKLPGSSFHMFRNILSRPSVIVDAVKRLREEHPDLKIEIVDPYTFFRLYKSFWEQTR